MCFLATTRVHEGLDKEKFVSQTVNMLNSGGSSKVGDNCIEAKGIN